MVGLLYYYYIIAHLCFWLKNGPDGGFFAYLLSVEKRWRTYGTRGGLPSLIGGYPPVAPMGQIIWSGGFRG